MTVLSAIYSVVISMTFECLTIVLTLIKVVPTARLLRPVESGFAPSFSRTIFHNGEILPPSTSSPSPQMTHRTHLINCDRQVHYISRELYNAT